MVLSDLDGGPVPHSTTLVTILGLNVLACTMMCLDLKTQIQRGHLPRPKKQSSCYKTATVRLELAVCLIPESDGMGHGRR